MWDKFIVHYWLPKQILTDQGFNFEGDLLRELCELAQVKKSEHQVTIPKLMGNANTLMLL